MIRGALTHLPGIGPERLSILRDVGVNSWDVLAHQSRALLQMGEDEWQQLLAAIEACERALLNRDLHFLTRHLAPCDHWRILDRFFDCASYFDIETDGLGGDSQVTVVGVYHCERLYAFVREENMEGLLDLLQETDLLVSFNGNSFDVPRILRAFNIPELPCPHVDLRWLCYHRGLRGGLKSIEFKLGVQRPLDVCGIDGAEAVRLWDVWQASRDQAARRQLLRYCCADALVLRHLARLILQQHGSFDGEDWISQEDPWSPLHESTLFTDLPAPCILPRHSPDSADRVSAARRLQERLRQRRSSPWSPR